MRSTHEPQHILHVISSLGDGGAEGVLYRLCTHETVIKHTVVSMMDEGKYGPLLAQQGVPVFYLRLARGRLSIKGVLQLWRIIRAHQPDTVQTWMYHADFLGGILAKLAGVRKVFWGIRQTDLKHGQSRWSTIVLARVNAALSWVIPDTIICCADRAKTVHVALGYASAKCVVISNGVDLNHFCFDSHKRQTLRSAWGVDESVPLIGMVARYDAQKDHANLLLSLMLLKQKARPFRCVLVGLGLSWQNQRLSASIHQFGLQQDVLLLNQYDDISAVMSALDLHVLSSAFGEGFPNVIAEAMACTTPCVATDVGATACIVGETGWIVKPNNANELAKAIELALMEQTNFSEKWHRRKLAARERIEREYELKIMLEAFLDVWHSRI